MSLKIWQINYNVIVPYRLASSLTLSQCVLDDSVSSLTDCASLLNNSFTYCDKNDPIPLSNHHDKILRLVFPFG